jgi:hypothetical protein
MDYEIIARLDSVQAKNVEISEAVTLLRSSAFSFRPMLGGACESGIARYFSGKLIKCNSIRQKKTFWLGYRILLPLLKVDSTVSCAFKRIEN